MADFPTSYYVSSLVEILHFISDDLVQCDAGTTISELFNDEFDDLDFELALTCFEGTHRLAFKEHVWKDPLFITKRFLFYEKSLAAALREEYESPPPGEY